MTSCKIADLLVLDAFSPINPNLNMKEKAINIIAEPITEAIISREYGRGIVIVDSSATTENMSVSEHIQNNNTFTITPPIVEMYYFENDGKSARNRRREAERKFKKRK